MLNALQQRASGPINYGELVRRFLAKRVGQNATKRWGEYEFEIDGADHFGKDFESSFVGKGGREKQNLIARKL